MAVRARLGERLVNAGLVTAEQLEKALQVHAATGEQLGRTLIKLGYLDEDSLVRMLCADAGIPYISLAEEVPDAAALALLPPTVAGKHLALPLHVDNGRLVVAMSDPFDLQAVTSVERSASRPIRVVAAPRDEIARMIARAYNGAARTGPPPPPAAKPQPHAPPAPRPQPVRPPSPAEPPADLIVSRPFETGDAATAATVADEITNRGVALGATDIHIEPLEDATRIRYRVDGLLQDGGKLPKSAQNPLVSRIKILAGIDIAESRLPQDGRYRLQAGDRIVDVRVSTYPTVFGEDIVLRLLDQSRASLDLQQLGIVADDLTVFRGALAQPHGLIVVTGPTGSGKTTTLYSALTEVNTGERCIITLEDPVEYELRDVRQAQVNVRAGLTFASGLRSILRHDPDIILIGEIRDRDTLQIALSAALTGHLVLTTLHTTTAAGAIPRLIDMGAEPFILASSAQVLISQRLVRMLCKNCKAPAVIPPVVRQRYHIPEATTVYGPVGCPACRERGYRGRTGIFEFIVIDQRIASAIHDRRPPEEIQRLSGRKTLLQDGLEKVRAGITSLDELLRVAMA